MYAQELTGVGRRRYANDEERRQAVTERCKARTTDETRTLAAASQRLRRAAASELCVTNQRAANVLQHSKARARLSNGACVARCLADAEQHVKTRVIETEGAREARHLADAEQHAQFRTLETVEQREERCLANAARNIERRARIAREDDIQAVCPVGL